MPLDYSNQPNLVWNGTHWIPVLPASTSGGTGLSVMGIDAAIARTNNPRVNAVMASPPTLTQSASANGALTHTVQWNAATGGVHNFYGGTLLAELGGAACKFLCTTLGGGLDGFLWEAETVVDAIKVQFAVFNYGGGFVRFIVNDQYTAATQATISGSATYYLTLDFTSVGGRAVRKIAIQCDSAVDFQTTSVLPTEGLSKPGGVPRRMFVVGDSFAAAGGTVTRSNAFPHVLGDLLGIRDVWNNGIGGTGYTNPGAGQTTFRQRLPDMVRATPDLVVIVGGHNDNAAGPAGVQAEIATYLAAIRAQSVLSAVPIIIAGVNGGNNSAAAIPMENAMSAAVSAFNDPLVFFVPQVTNPAGPYFTGTGSTAAPTGSGNCDIYISADSIHPNDAGHAYMARLMADDINRLVFRP